MDWHKILNVLHSNVDERISMSEQRHRSFKLFSGVAALYWEPVITVTKSRTTRETAEKIVFLALTYKIKLRNPDKGWLYLMAGNKTVTRRFVSIGPVTCQDFATYAGAKTLWLCCYLIITESQTELVARSYIMHSTSGLHWPNYFK